MKSEPGGITFGMDFVEAIITTVIVRAVDAIGYALGMIILAAVVFAAACVIHYVLKWSGAFKGPPPR